MDLENASRLLRGYGFAARNIIGGKIIDGIFELLAFMDYRMLIYLSMYHPDMETRLRLLRKRGVHVGEHVFIDPGVFIEITTPQSIVIEDHVGIGYGAVIYAHDATAGRYIDLPMRLRGTRLCYGSGVGFGSLVMPGVTIGKWAAVMPGSVVTKDVPEGKVVGGNPAEVKCDLVDIGLAWQDDVLAHPDDYYDHPNPFRPPSTPWDHLVTWREKNPPIHHYTEIRTGTPFDYILDAKEAEKKESK